MQNQFLVGETIYLRPLEPSDAEMLAACNNDPEVRLSFFTHTPTNLHQTADRIRGFYGPGADYLPFAICDRSDDVAFGVTALHRLDLVSRAAVFSICITDPAFRGRGLAYPATQLMMQYAFNVLNLNRVQLHVWTGNAAGLRVYEKAGFQREGTLREAMRHDGKYCDFHVMGMLAMEWKP